VAVIVVMEKSALANGNGICNPSFYQTCDKRAFR
jgi:hypothetical protein